MNSAEHRRMLIGNWKMHGRQRDLDQIAAIAQEIETDAVPVIICPPATLVAPAVAQVRGSFLTIGAQDCHSAESGAHTGDVAAEMLAELGAVAVIVGHSERRSDHAEDNFTVAAKAMAAWRAGLLAVICIGGSEAEQVTGRTLAVIAKQLSESVPDGSTSENTVIAYEPVWAIGTGRTPSVDEISSVHSFIRQQLTDRFGPDGKQFRILYGGSVKASNAAEIFTADEVAGGLVGGASQNASGFLPILAALR